MNQKIYCIGIGGIGVSALARYYRARGAMVSGSDRADSDLISDLRREGIVISIGHKAQHISRNTDMVIYSAAVREENPEMQEARSRGIPVLSYAEALGELTKHYITIAVSGSHGKSTTTALLSLMLIKAGLDPTVIVGTRLAEFNGSNMRLGASRYLVIEADEWNRSFWYYAPAIAVITNIDKEHLDTYADLAGVIAGFRHYIISLPPAATVIINKEDKNSMRAAQGAACRIVLFNQGGVLSARWPLKIAGNFNQLNAEAAWRAAEMLGVNKKTAMEAVGAYRGSWRRMERLEPHAFSKKELPRGTFFSDYAHHPNEIKATIQAFREQYPRRRLLIIFQPHQEERLTNLFEDFTQAFDGASQVGILPVYKVVGRELEGGKTSEDLYKALRGLREGKAKDSIVYLKKFADAFKLMGGQVVVFMGAGDIDAEARKYFKSQLLPR